MLRWVVLCCVVLCSVVLCCVVLCWVVLDWVVRVCVGNCAEVMELTFSLLPSEIKEKKNVRLGPGHTETNFGVSAEAELPLPLRRKPRFPRRRFLRAEPPLWRIRFCRNF